MSSGNDFSDGNDLCPKVNDPYEKIKVDCRSVKICLGLHVWQRHLMISFYKTAANLRL